MRQRVDDRDGARVRAEGAAGRRADDRARRDGAGAGARAARAAVRRARRWRSLLVTHDLPVVAHVCDRAAVMYAGTLAEVGPLDTLYHDPGHPYTRRLFEATPELRGGRALASIPGVPPPLDRPHAGCPFQPRCDRRFDPCPVVTPALLQLGSGARRRVPSQRPGHDVSAAPLLEVRDLHVSFPVPRGVAGALARRPPTVAARRRRRLVRPRRRRAAGAGRRVGLGQVDDGAGAAAPRRARPRQHPPRRRGRAGRARARDPHAAPARLADLPGPLPGAEPAPARARRGRRGAGDPGRRRRSRGPGHARAGGGRADAARDLPRAAPARALGRPAPARGDRGRPRARARAADRRRAGLDARRLGARRRARGARRPAPPRDRGADDHPRPVDGRAVRRPHRGHVPGPRGRGGAGPRGDRRPAAPLHARAHLGRARRRPAPPDRAADHRRRDPGRHAHPERLPLPPALPGAAGELLGGRPAARAGARRGARPPGGLRPRAPCDEPAPLLEETR